MFDQKFSLQKKEENDCMLPSTEANTEAAVAEALVAARLESSAGRAYPPQGLII